MPVQARKWRSGLRRSKYNAIKTKVDGISFDSKLEAKYYQELKLRQAAGEITIERVHPKYPIQVRGKQVCNVVLDFIYQDLATMKRHYVDCKGFDNALSKLKRRIVEAEYDLIVEIVSK